LVAGQAAQAAELCDQVRQQAGLPKQRLLEATRGAILARRSQGIPLLAEQLRSQDLSFFRLGLTVARELPGRDVADALVAEALRAAPERGALMLGALADRREVVVSPVLLQAMRSGPKPLRVAALAVVGRWGDASSVPALLETALEADQDLTHTAREALAQLPGDKIDAEIAARLGRSEGKMQRLLMELAGQRRIAAAAGTLLKSLEHPDAETRGAALTALGATIGPDQLALLVAQAVTPRHAEDGPLARQALRAAAVRMPDREACARELMAAWPRASLATRVALLETLGAVGGSVALEAVGTAVQSTEPQLQDTGSRLLGEWMTADAAPVLLDLAKTASEDKYQVRALRGYIRIARQFVLPPDQRAEMCRQALEAARREAEQKLVLQVLERYPSLEMLKLAVQASKVAALKEDGARTALSIARKLGGESAETLKLLAEQGLEPVKLEIVKAEYGAGGQVQDVTELLRKQVGDYPLITLSSPSYNAAFGGDPAPNVVKQLKVQYKINGRPGEVTFAENAVILLAVPK
jgi:hypothetical protein